MKNLLFKTTFLFLVFFSHFSFAKISIEKNKDLSRSERKHAEDVCNRTASFYNWYLTYLHKNNEPAANSAVYEQYLSAKMRSEIFQNEKEIDLIFCKKDIDKKCNIFIKPISYAKDKIELLLRIEGKYNYSVKLSMIIQKQNWVIDSVSLFENM